MSSKLEEHVVNIGDIDVYADEHYVQVTVDGDTVLYIRRNGTGGLKDFANALNSLIK